MAAPPRFATLRETDLAIKDGPLDGAGLRDALKRLFAQLNPSLDRTNNVTAKGITLGENIRCDTLTIKATHGVAQTVRLQSIKQANTCLVVGGDTLLPYPIAPVQMLQPAQGGGAPSASVTVFFTGGTGTANVRLWLFEDGVQATQTPTYGTPEAWNAPTLLNGWSIYGGGFSPPGYYKDAVGRVWVRCAATNVAGTIAGNALFTLPVGYRPAFQHVFNSWDADASAIAERVDVKTTGDVVLFQPAAAGDIQCFNFSFDTR